MTDSFHTPTLELLKPIPNFSRSKPPYCPYVCNHCSKAFSSTQALGGHQNAHRSEKDKGKRQQRASSKNKKRATSSKPQNRNANPPTARSTELKIALEDELFRKPKRTEGLSSGVGSTMPNNLPFWSGPSCRCSEKVANSWPLFVARFRLSNNSPDTAVVVDSSLPQLQTLDGAKEAGDNNQELDLTLKL